MNLDLRFYFSLFLRRLPVMLTIFLVCSVLGVATAYNAAPTYTSSARLLIEEAQIEVGVANSINPDQQLRLIRERLLTRANLIDIANELNVFEDMQDMTPDAIFTEMLANTSVQLSGGRNQVTLMRISFEARTGQIAARVVSEYLTLIQADNSSNTNAQVENTLAFFQREVDRLSADLDQQSARIVSFKAENADALPEDLDFRYGRQAQLLERIDRLEKDFADLERQRDEAIRFFETTGRLSRPGGTALSPEEQQLEQLELELRRARAVYSDTNPRVVLLQNQIDQLREIVSETQPNDVDDTFQSPENALLQLRIAEFEDRMASNVNERAEIETELTQIDSSIQATAANGIALATLERDFANLQSRYNAANNNLDRSRLALDIEASNQGQKLTIIENPNVPQDPSGPNRIRIATIGVGAGLALAAGFFVLLEITNRTIRRPEEIEAKFNVTPIASIPYMESKRQRRMRMALLAGALLVVLIGVPLILWYIDTYYLPLDVIVARITNRLGL
ncbi:Uncharacterized protein involved in exopolysaccharide biosynthesis [Cognatiyoonia sediminum]|uniref:Uncharacterized protein involved in exopolysaccharide biosynthesis n=1 Tax=Cognatiyoonia sediminum TaxID=1508389 RepID=A0A1M5Q2M7_9RHOB|nr:hypothetical protein [Cognatiyoonia sediminum]SHH07733.1 Uncharacterized protein involved in exopolysaccharide biosynthesis [Cognatiyoonia sediminum]